LDTVESAAQIAGTDNDSLYHTEQNDYTFSYEIPVLAEPRTYIMVVHFTGLVFSAPGKRIFDVFIESDHVLDDLDLCKTDSAAFLAGRYVFKRKSEMDP
jgi:Malectin domain